MTDCVLHFIDFEGSRESGVVEYGVVSVAQTGIIAAHTSLCCPKGPIDAASFAQHGIHTHEALPFPAFDQAWALFSGLRQGGLLAAHHASVEEGFLRAYWPVAPASVDPLSGGLCSTWGPWVDTLRLAQRLLPEATSHKLSDLVPALGLGAALEALAEHYCPRSRRKAHCALYDALASALLFAYLRERNPVLNDWASALTLSASGAKAHQARNQRELF